jgi:hypothetical protein
MMDLRALFIRIGGEINAESEVGLKGGKDSGESQLPRPSHLDCRSCPWVWASEQRSAWQGQWEPICDTPSRRPRCRRAMAPWAACRRWAGEHCSFPASSS